MSWDHDIRSVKCPCGCGTIEQEVRSDDWGRVESYSPIIKCEKCSKEYKLVTLSWSSPFSWKGGGSAYYLVPISTDLTCKYENKYGDKNHCDGLSEFCILMITEYPKELLLEAINEVNTKTNVSSLSGFASRLATIRKKRYKSARITDLRVDIQQALNHYDAFDGNYYQLKEEKKINDEIYRQYVEKIKSTGILIDL